MEDIKDALKEKNLTFGAEKTLKKLRNGEVKQVFIAKNCPESVKKTIKHYAGLGKISVLELDINNEELGTACKKPFSVAVLSY